MAPLPVSPNDEGTEYLESRLLPSLEKIPCTLANERVHVTLGLIL